MDDKVGGLKGREKVRVSSGKWWREKQEGAERRVAGKKSVEQASRLCC